MNIINKIKEFFTPEKQHYTAHEHSSSFEYKCCLCNQEFSYEYELVEHFYSCMINNYKKFILNIQTDCLLIDILHILNAPVEIYGVNLHDAYRSFSKPIFTAEELYIIFKKNEVLRDFRNLPDIGIIGTFWYVMDFIKFKGNSTHELIKMPLFDKIFFDQGLITTKHVFDSTQYGLTDKGLKLKELLLEQPTITSRFFSELKEPGRQIYTDFYNFLARHPKIFEEEIKVLNGMRF